MNKNLVLDVNENPSKLKDWFLFAIQHVLAMLVAFITVPLITGLPIGPTLIAAGVLFYFGSGPVRGFAVTLAVGIVTSLFTSVTVTRLFITAWFNKYKPKALPI